MPQSSLAPILLLAGLLASSVAAAVPDKHAVLTAVEGDGFLKEAIVAIENVTEKRKTDGFFAQSFVATSSTVSAVAFEMSFLDKTTWMRVELAHDADGWPGEVMARTWLLSVQEVSWGRIVFDLPFTQVVKGQRYWVTYCDFVVGQNQFATGINFNFAYEDTYAAGTTSREGCPPKDEGDVHFVIYTETAPLEGQRPPTQEELRMMPDDPEIPWRKKAAFRAPGC